jgi:serine/threonine-protein kinase
MQGELIAGRYEIEAVLGSGGMATVYRAHDRVLERVVALKVLDPRHEADPDVVGRFRDEARAAARLTHPNVVGVLDRVMHGGREFIVFEHVEGETLKQLVIRDGPLEPARAAALGCGVARALAAAHDRGIVHRDVKSQNVIVGEDGRPRVADFGVARAPGSEQRTESGAIVGTGTYIAPEQARGERVDGAADVYALGVVLYELLTGAPPYDGVNAVAVAMRHVNDPVPRVREGAPNCPPGLAALVEGCLAKEPERRPSATALAGALEREARSPVQPAPSSLPEEEGEERTLVISRRPAPPRRRRPWLWIALAVLAVVVGAGAVAVLLGGGSGSGGGAAVPITAVASFDPVGGDGEHDETLALATDGDLSTFWTTEGYDGDFASFKDGVGIVFDAGQTRSLDSLTIESDLGGFTAEVKGCSSPECVDPVAIAGAQEAGATTTWDLGGAEARYLLLWITEMSPDAEGKDRAHVNEATARA